MNEKLYKNDYLKVDDTHLIYFETYGSPDKKPILFIHGGPGGKLNSKSLIEIDNEKCFAIFYDQRGSGQSMPNGEIENNTTDDLINDIKLLLAHLNIKKTAICAGSWGACLGLLFAEKYPEMIDEMFLNCTFLARRADAEFLYDGVKEIFPDLHSEFMANIPALYQKNVAAYLYNQMLNLPMSEKKKITALMANYEYSLMKTTFSKTNNLDAETMTDEDIIPTLLFLHYEANNFFIADNQIIDNSDKIKDIKITFIHGRYDMDAPLSGVWNLHKKLPKSSLTIVPYEGHSGDFKKYLLNNAINNYLNH